jgi:hypothetical protein
MRAALLLLFLVACEAAHNDALGAHCYCGYNDDGSGDYFGFDCCERKGCVNSNMYKIYEIEENLYLAFERCTACEDCPAGQYRVNCGGESGPGQCLGCSSCTPGKYIKEGCSYFKDTVCVDWTITTCNAGRLVTQPLGDDGREVLCVPW